MISTNLMLGMTITSNNGNVVNELGLEETIATILKLLHILLGTAASNLLIIYA